MKNMTDASFEGRVAAVLDRMANQVHEPADGPPPRLLHRAYRRMSIVAIGAALFASALGVAGSLVFGMLTGDGPSILPHVHGSPQLALGGTGWGDQRDHAQVAVLPRQPAGGAGWVLVSAARPPHHPRYRLRPVGTAGGPITAGPIILRAGGGIQGHGSGHHRHHRHGGRHHRRHRGGGNRRMH